MGVAIVTGASSGLGAGLARALARDGYRVGLIARREGALEAVRVGIDSEGGEALVLPCDVRDGPGVHAAVEACRSRWGEVDLLVCSAGVSTVTPVGGFHAADVARLLDVNVVGAAHAIEAVLPSMLERGRGHLVGIGSLAGYGGLARTAAYSASKGAMHNLFESLRVDLRGRGVDVTLVTPGYVRTPLTDVNEHPMPFLIELDDAVAAIMKAVRRRRRLFAFPWPLSTVVRAGQVLPRPLYDRLVGLHRRSKRDAPSPFPQGAAGPSSPPQSPEIDRPSDFHRSMRDRVATLIRGRRDRLARLLGRPLSMPYADESPLSREARSHLVEEGEDLYWNELEWENITEEEATDGPPLSELTFPGLLAFVRGLLLTETNPDALAPAEPRPQVVEDLMAFLAGRILELEERLAHPPVDDEQRLRGELVMTDRLLDIVLYRFHGLSDQEIERVETVRTH